MRKTPRISLLPKRQPGSHNAEAALALLRPENAPPHSASHWQNGHQHPRHRESHPALRRTSTCTTERLTAQSHVHMPRRPRSCCTPWWKPTRTKQVLETRINQALHLLSSEQTQNGLTAMFTTAVKDYQEKAPRLSSPLRTIEKETNDERMASATAIASPVDREIDEALMTGPGRHDHEALVERQEAPCALAW